MGKNKVLLAPPFVVMALASPSLALVGFRGIGHVPGPTPESTITDVSPNGQWLSGGVNTPDGYRGFRMPVNGAIQVIAGSSSASGAADNGAVSGIYTQGTPGNWRPFRYSDANGFQPLGNLGGTSPHGEAWAISADGNVVVGYSSNTSGQTEAFRWTSTSGMSGIGNSGATARSGIAWGVSSDGTTVVGIGTPTPNDVIGFRWNAALGTPQDLGDLPGGNNTTRAYTANADGSVIVGEGSATGGTRAFRWTSSGGMSDLGVTSGLNYSVANDVNDPGDVVVGTVGITLTNTYEPFIWRDGFGMRLLRDYFVNDLDADLTGWRLLQAYVNGDATVFAGSAYNPQGQFEGWIMVVPEPQFGAVAFLASAMTRRGSQRARRN